MKGCFAPETMSLMGRVCDGAYAELDLIAPGATRSIRRDIATRVMAAVSAGERDYANLKAFALKKRSFSGQWPVEYARIRA